MSVTRVMQGSTGVWGKVAMLPHAQHTREQVLQMVEHVFSVRPIRAIRARKGFRNELVLKQPMDTVRLEATYTDLGRGEIPALTGTGASRYAAEKFRPSQQTSTRNAAAQHRSS